MIINQLKISINKLTKLNKSGKITKEEMVLINKKISKKYRINPQDILEVKILKKSLDARKKYELCFTYNLNVKIKNEKTNDEAIKNNFNPIFQDIKNKDNTIVIGAGPAGLFCTYILALNGMNPVMIEQGSCIEKRTRQVSEFWENSDKLNEYSNVTFGEGGAGTFSDGKLNTSVKDKSGIINFIKKVFVRNGAPEEIEYLDKPHIGTDELRGVIINIRKKILELGGSIYFDTAMEDIVIENNKVKSVKCINLENKEQMNFECDNLVLAIGHSARKTYSVLKDILNMENKPFAVGFRVQHPQKMIDTIQYGKVYNTLFPADYKLRYHADNGRSVFSFCMCPGGYVVNSSTQKGHSVVNGMSNHKRDSLNANSAIVINVNTSDYPEDILSGVYYQTEFEKKAYELAQGKIPLQLLGDFVMDKSSTEIGNIKPQIKGEYCLCNMRHIYPDYINNAFIDGMEYFDRIISGFNSNDVLLCGVETRTSSPVKILRDEKYQSNISGIYPCGEGAGYAGGIISAAVDGIKIAKAILNNI